MLNTCMYFNNFIICMEVSRLPNVSSTVVLYHISSFLSSQKQVLRQCFKNIHFVIVPKLIWCLSKSNYNTYLHINKKKDLRVIKETI